VDADVVIVGAGPTGLTLAAELGLAGVRALVLERRERIGETGRASGLNGRILEVLRYRGLLERLSAAGRGPFPSPSIPFGGMELDLSGVTGEPLRALHLAQPRLERLLDERARELGAEVRRGHPVTGVRQDRDAVTAEVRGPDGPYRVTARYLVGCDGAYSGVRELVGIAFPGSTSAEVNRLAQVAVPGSVTRLDNGDLDVPGLGRLRAGFTRTDRGVFAFGSRGEGDLLVQTTEEDDPSGAGGDAPLTLAEFRASVRRVLGADVPFTDARRLSRYRFQARLAGRYRAGRVLVAGDAAHQVPATGVGLNVGMLDAVNLGWKLAGAVRGHTPDDAPDAVLDTYHDERHFAATRTMLQARAQQALRRGSDAADDALREVFRQLCADEQPLRRIAALVGGTDLAYPSPDPSPDTSPGPLAGTFVPDLSLCTDDGGTTSIARLMHAARPVLLLLADRADLRETAGAWQDRVDIRAATTDDRPADDRPTLGRPADALLIRPDAHLAWAAATGEPAATAAPALRAALSRWFGTP
jgi:2-polyprenyl-6-methoxyphenol hydroxylase-like FAD-dependent oxidoreductase